VEEIPGAEALKLAPSMRGDKRVAVRFNLAAREASKDVVAEDYTKQFDASDNLKYALSPEAVNENQKPLGRPSTTAGASAGTSPALASAKH
jgi:hypothetical protein